MQQILAVILLGMLCSLGACSDSSTKGSMKDLELKIYPSVAGTNNTMTVNINGDLTGGGFGDTAQDTANTSDLSPELDIVPNIAEAGASVVTGTAAAVSSKLDNRKTDSDNPTSNTTNETTTPAIVPVVTPGEETPTPTVTDDTHTPVDTPTSVPDGYLPQVFSLEYPVHERSFSWIDHTTGADFTSPIYLDDGHGLFKVEDPTNTFYSTNDQRWFGGVNQRDKLCAEDGKCWASYFSATGVQTDKVTLWYKGGE